MNDTRNELRRSMGFAPERMVHRILERTGHIVTEGQIETAGKTYVQASVWTAAAYAVIDGARLVGRTLWILATLASIGFAGTWLYLHWPQVVRWLK